MKDDALVMRFLNSVDGLLDGRGVVRGAVGFHGKLIGREVDRAGVIEPLRIVGRRLRGRGGGGENGNRGCDCECFVTSANAHLAPFLA